MRPPEILLASCLLLPPCAGATTVASEPDDNVEHPRSQPAAANDPGVDVPSKKEEGVPRGEAERIWTLEALVGATYNDNFFYRGDGGGQEVPDAVLTGLSLESRWVVPAGVGKLTVGLTLGGVVTDDVDDADRATGGAGIEYRRRRTRIEAGYALEPNRIFTEEGDGTFYDYQTLILGVRRDLSRRMWMGAEYEAPRWRFDPESKTRDADGRELTATLRFPLGGRFAMRASLLAETKRAEDPQYSADTRGWAAAFELPVHSRVQLFARYRHRDRDYDDALPGQANFEREDRIQDALLSARVHIGSRWGFRVEDQFRRAASHRDDRNYDANQVSLGFFVLF